MKSPACGGGMRCADRKRIGQIFKIDETARGAQLRQRQRPAARNCAHPFQKICAHLRPVDQWRTHNDHFQSGALASSAQRDFRRIFGMPIGSEGAGESSSRQGRPGSISPSALMLLTKIKRLAPARAAAAATRSVPATLVSWQAARNRGVFSDVSWTRAARCTTVSSGAALEHFSVRLHKERARRQYEQYGEREATQGKPLKNALEDRTSANTVCPAALSVWHTALPIKPFAPVTRIFILQFIFCLKTGSHRQMSFIYIPEILEPILRNESSSTQDLYRCSLVYGQIPRQTKPLLEHAALRESASPWLRRLAEAVPPEKLGNLRGNAFIFRRLLEGFRQEEARSHAQEKQSLKNLLKPLQSQLLPSTLLQKEIDAIADQVLESAPTELSVEQMRAELKEAGFEQEIEYLERNGELSWTKINHLYAKGGVLALLRAPTPEALDAFAQISDADISDGIVALIERQHRMSESKKPEDCAEAKRAADVANRMARSGPFFVNYPDPSGRIPLHYASQDGKLTQTVQDLVNYGADVYWKSDLGQIPAHTAASAGRTDALEILFNTGGLDAIHSRDHQGYTPLNFAAFSQDASQFLQDKGAELLMISISNLV